MGFLTQNEVMGFDLWSGAQVWAETPWSDKREHFEIAFSLENTNSIFSHSFLPVNEIVGHIARGYFGSWYKLLYWD